MEANVQNVCGVNFSLFIIFFWRLVSSSFAQSQVGKKHKLERNAIEIKNTMMCTTKRKRVGRKRRHSNFLRNLKECEVKRTSHFELFQCFRRTKKRCKLRHTGNIHFLLLQWACHAFLFLPLLPFNYPVI